MLEAAIEKKLGWGGRRVGAGRPKGRWRSDPPHRSRTPFASDAPIHVVLRACSWIDSFRQRRVYQVTNRVLARYLGLDDFRVVHFSIQTNHFHFLIEAANQDVLSRRMQSLVITLAKAINRALGLIGKVFQFRYHDTVITTARQARSSLSYVLNNWRKHVQHCKGGRVSQRALDPYASGRALDGWCAPVETDGPLTLPVSPPRTRLLRSDWRRFGPLDPYDTPGLLRR